MKSKKQLSNLNKKVQSKKRNKNLTGGAGGSTIPVLDMEGKYLFLDVDRTLVNRHVCIEPDPRDPGFRDRILDDEKEKENYNKLIELLTEFKARGGKAHIITRCEKEVNMMEADKTSYHPYFNKIVEQLNGEGAKDSVISANDRLPTFPYGEEEQKNKDYWSYAKSIVMYYLFRNLVLKGKKLKLSDFILIDDDVGNGQVAADFGFTGYTKGSSTEGNSIGLPMTNNALKTILNEGRESPEYNPVDETKFTKKTQRRKAYERFKSIEDLERLVSFAIEAQNKIPNSV